MTKEDPNVQDYEIIDYRTNAAEVLREKLIDAQTPGYQVECDPEEAAVAGAFIEDALSELDAAESAIDLQTSTPEVGSDSDSRE
jgi:hypothetical protein